MTVEKNEHEELEKFVELLLLDFATKSGWTLSQTITYTSYALKGCKIYHTTEELMARLNKSENIS